MMTTASRAKTDTMLSGIVAGLVTGLITTLTDIIPMAAFVFSGSLEPYVATGIGINLFSSAIIGLIIALKSSFGGMVAFPVAEEMAALAVILGAVARQIPTSATPEEVILTIVAAIALSSLLVGAFLLVLGHLRFGELIRFLPYPVVGGFLGGLGCLLTLGALQVMAGVGTVAQLPMLLQPELLIKWLPGVVFAIALLLITRRFKHLLVIPACFLGVTGLFYLVLALTRTPIADAFQQRWLLGPFPSGQLWRPITLLNLTQVDWRLVLTQVPGMFALVLITALSILLVSSGLELVVKQDLELNQELKAAGIANLVSGALGGLLGSQTIGATLLARQSGGNSRLTGIVVAGFYLTVLLAGLSLLSFFPRFVAGGAMLFIGIPLILAWVYEGWFKLSRVDYGILLLIAGVIVTFGFMQGVIVGLVAAIALFVFKYSQIDVTRYALSGGSYLSRVRRSPTQERLLRQDGHQIQILQLQGFIFFGTAYRLLTQIRQLGDRSEQPPQFLVLDFRLVSGVDSSAAMSFLKLKQFAQQHSITLVLTSLSKRILQQFQHEGVLPDPLCQQFGSLNEGIAWCETQLLEAGQFRRRRTLPIALQLEQWLGKNPEIPTFLDYLDEREVSDGAYLFHQGDRPEGLYFLEYGQVSLLKEDEPSQRFETLGSGTIVGETDFFAHNPYRLSAIADIPSTLHFLSEDALQRMQQEHPALASQFSQAINTLLSERLVQAQSELEVLLK